MKLTLQRDQSATETEITIRYADMNSRLQKIIEELQQFGFALTGYQQSREYQVPLDTIYYIDSIDGKTFIYQIKEVYESKETLSSLITKLPQTAFVRISKNCIININFMKYVEPLYNHRLTAVLKNGEKLVITRNYIESLRTHLKGAQL